MMKMTKNKVALTLTAVAAAVLVACGGGGSSGGGSASASGKVIDGYVSGATVFVDLNNNGTFDSGEPNTKTNANGDYSLSPVTQGAKLVSFGGTDVSTGNPSTLVLSTVVSAAGTVSNAHMSPVTTLIAQLAGPGATPAALAAAQTKVNSLLGLPSTTNLLAVDPIQTANDLGATQTARTDALSITKAVVQLATLIKTAQDQTTTAAASLAAQASVLSALATRANNSTVTDLTSATDIQAVFTAAAVTVSNSEVTALANANTAIESATSTDAVATQQNTYEDTNTTNAPVPDVGNGGSPTGGSGTGGTGGSNT